MKRDLVKGFEDVQWRIANDVLTQDQFRRVNDDGYLCNNGCGRGPGNWRREPMPEKRALNPVALCDACHAELPPNQASA